MNYFCNVKFDVLNTLGKQLESESKRKKKQGKNVLVVSHPIQTTHHVEPMAVSPLVMTVCTQGCS